MNKFSSEELESEDELFEHHKFKVDKGQEVIRIDKFLSILNLV
jgi:23S rRNA pseudouridine1911/1915/1917 synthase